MIDTQVLQLALRARLATLSVATCSGVNLSAAGAVYTRASGSFITGGFSVGMEVTPTGFTDTDKSTVIGLTGSTLTVNRTLTTETSASGRTLSVGLPSDCAWENVAFEPTTGTPWLEEELVPGPTRQNTLGPYGELVTQLLYILRIHTPEDTGVGAPNRYADALLTLFTPRTEIQFGSNIARVRTDTGPYRGQLRRFQTGFATVPVTFPLEIRTANTI